MSKKKQWSWYWLNTRGLSVALASSSDLTASDCSSLSTWHGTEANIITQLRIVSAQLSHSHHFRLVGRLPSGRGSVGSLLVSTASQENLETEASLIIFTGRMWFLSNLWGKVAKETQGTWSREQLPSGVTLSSATGLFTARVATMYRFCLVCVLSLIHIWRCRRSYACRSRWSPYH